MTNLKTSTIEEINEMTTKKIEVHPFCRLLKYSNFVGKDLKSVVNYLIDEADLDLKSEVYQYLVDAFPEAKSLSISGAEILSALQTMDPDPAFILKADAIINRYYELNK